MDCVATASNDPDLQAVTDMIIIAFFFLLWTREYTGTKSDSSPIRLSDVMFSVGCTVFDTATATDNELSAAVLVICLFTTQKNGVGGEKLDTGSQETHCYAQRRPCGGE